MSEPYLGEITMFAGNFAPRGWAFCNGQLLPIAQNTALFSLIGTIYGGDGRTTTALPDLQGRAPMHPGRGPGLTNRVIGEKGGLETSILQTGQVPSHDHALAASGDDNQSASPIAGVPGLAEEAQYRGAGDSSMNAAVLDPVGNGAAHNNMQPFTTINFIIALVGQYPSRG